MLNKPLINLVPQSKKYVFLTVLLKTVGLLSNFVLIFAIAALINLQMSQPHQTLLFSQMALPLTFIALSLLVTFISSRFSSLTSFYSSKEVKKTLRSLIYNKLLRLGPDYQEKAETAKIIQLTVEGVEQIEIWFGQYLPQFFYSMIAAVLTFTLLAFINLKMALILLFCVPLIPVSIIAVQKIAKKILGRYMDEYANLADHYLENLQGLTTLKIYNADQDRQQLLNTQAQNFRRITMKVLSFQLNSIIIMDTVAYAGAGLGIMVALQSFLSGQQTLSRTLICILISADFFIPLRRLGSYFHTAMNGTTASKNIFELLNKKENTKGGASLPLSPASTLSSATPSNGGHPRNAPVTFSQAKPLFQLQNVCCSYGQRQVLNNINLTIPQGSFTAFTGKSGSGKSTTAKILAGINTSYTGQITLNLADKSYNLSEIAPESLYQFCTYISHKDWIFKGTVRDCLLEGNPAATEQQMWTALKQVQLDDFVQQNGGLDFFIKEDAANLSGGQKQRLSIARALLHDSPVYIFDESTSNIDVESETAIYQLLHQLKGTKTIITISHRKENCKDADQIFAFEKGILQGDVK